MPGTAKTNEFMLGTATVMIGPVADLFDLNPTDHSIGLVKNFTLTSEPTYTELTQGVQNTIVHSIMTGNTVRATMEMYEYTAKNIAYALGISGADTVAPMTTATAVNGAILDGDTDFDVDSATGITVGSYVMILVDNEDNFVIRKVTSVTSNTLGVNAALPAIADNAVVRKVNEVKIGSKEDQPFYGVKIAGKAANGEPLVILIPKVRVTKGFNMAFSSDDYSNLPVELTVYDLVSTDTHYAYFDGAQAKVYRR